MQSAIKTAKLFTYQSTYGTVRTFTQYKKGDWPQKESQFRTLAMPAFFDCDTITGLFFRAWADEKEKYYTDFPRRYIPAVSDIA
ncbi:hypothetical protein M8X74_004148 [Salmonella enterica]|nr:hypothetical protein [Salmonella enterica]EJF5594675.1 hypothetical protein [Salmonella enterica]EJF5825840.1 hypothetical protein [Salmonella enterica]EJF5844552.1 hypothetical protein [Salmonella enterica]EJF5917029.1 hypothetical protein [Salmonella enterica]